MTDIIRSIINELAKKPFSKSFTVISFDSLKPDQLLQVLNDVLGEIDTGNKLDIREEDPEQTVIRMLNMLRVLKYKPEEDDPSTLRTGLVSGSSKVIYPILAWLLPRVADLQVRAYLAKFLVKVDIPQEIRADIDVEELYQQYEERIEQFKITHKQLEEVKRKGFTTSEIRKDIDAMEQEQESVSRKIEKLKQQVEGTPNIDQTLEVVGAFRKEKEKSRELSQQHISQNQLLNQAEQRIQRLQRQVKEIRAANTGATAEGILQRLEQDVDVAKYIVNDKLPKEIEMRKKDLFIYERVLSDTSLTARDLEDIRDKIDKVKSDINEMIMKRMMKSEDNNLVMFRQQAAIVANKKSSLVEKINEQRSELNGLKEDEQDKKQRLGTLQGDTIVKEDDFKEYVKNLRIKSTRYKQMKGEISYLKSESGVLSKTIFILEEQLKSSAVDVSALEARLGIKGFTSVQGNLEKVSTDKARVDEKKSQNLQQMSSTVQELHDQIAAKKVDLAPLVKNLNSLRQQAQILGHEHDTTKRRYDGIVSSVDSSLGSIVREVESMRKRYQDDQLRYCKLKSEISIFNVNLKRVQDELKNYAAAGSSHDRQKSYKEQLTAKVSDQERAVKNLKGEEKEIAEKQTERIQQAVMWRDLVKVLQLKKQLREGIIQEK
ncbi:intraflagellar transport protein 81 homolog [Folsomia candida]|uniref:Intraflagellar transport protein 81 homolog n=1 Tax=Folsomia candida TaxID=158441 RepID=A0A226DN84_FOLCA|nr:intraflagellar transport protein 81 homolog [Folsomia candida]OXA46468.1 Intraflagellar transport protein 81 [Folsomia candida]